MKPLRQPLGAAAQSENQPSPTIPEDDGSAAGPKHTWDFTPHGAEFVVRLEVPGPYPNFPATVAEAFRSSEIPHDHIPTEAAVVLSQPLLSASEHEIWELRVSAPSWADAGTIFDAVSTSSGNSKSLLRSLSEIEGVTVVAGGAPLYRAWTLTSSASED